MEKVITKVEKYLKDSEDVLVGIAEERALLLGAPCGTGKTYTVINTLKARGEKFIFLVPNVSVKEQLATDYGLKIVGGESGLSLNKCIEFGFEELVACYEALQDKYMNDKSKEALKDYVLVWDEFHTVLGDIHYRNNTNLLELLEITKRFILLTANPEKIENLVPITKYISVESSHKIEAGVKVIKPNNGRISKTHYNKLIREITKSCTHNLMIISTGVETLKEATGLEVLTAKDRENEKIKAITNGMLPEGSTITTNLFNAGLSIKNKEEVNLIIDFKNYDVNYANYLQMINRFRESKKVNVWILDRNQRQVKACDCEIKEWLYDMVDKLNDGVVSPRESELFNETFFPALTLNASKYGINESRIPIVEQRLNGNRESTIDLARRVADDNNWSFEVLTYDELMATEKLESIKRGKKPKAILRELFVTEEKINRFAEIYFRYRVKKSEGIKVYLNKNYSDEMRVLRELTQDKKSVRDTLDRLTSKMENNELNIKKILNNYFEPASKFEELNLSEDERFRIREKIMITTSDNTRMARVRSIFADEFPAFNPKTTITPNNKVKELLEYFGIKVRRNSEDTNITLV